MQSAHGNKALPLSLSPRVWHYKRLRIGINRGWILPEDSGFLPFFQVLCRLRIAIPGRCLLPFRPPEDDSHQVVRAGSVIAILHGRSDLVVRLGDHIGEVDLLWVVAQGGKGEYFSHRASLITFKPSSRLYEYECVKF